MIKKGKTYGQNSKIIFFLKKHENSKKHACQNMVAVVTASSVNNDMSYQIVPKQISGKVKKV